MWEIFSHPVWNLIVIVLGIATPIIFFLIQRSRKGIGYTLVSSSEVLKHPSKSLQGRLQILYMGKQVSNVHHILLRIFNSGNVPIRLEDYEIPITIDFGNKAQILRRVLSKSSDDINVKDKLGKNKITLNKFLFNKGESIKYSIFLADCDGTLNISGRIAGVNEIKEIENPLSLERVIKFLLVISVIPLLFASILSIYLAVISGNIPDVSQNLIELTRSIAFMSGFAFILILLILPMFKLLR